MRILKADYYQLKSGEDRTIRERVLAESPLETEVLRQAILADKWDLMPEHLAMLGPDRYVHAMRLCSGGGQAVFHPRFNQQVVWHYRVGEQFPDPVLSGFFEMRVGLFEKQLGTQLGDFKLFACLALLRRPPFQTGWDGPPREFFVCPWWYFFSGRAEPHGVAFKSNVQDFDNGPLFVSSLSESHAEWDCLAPHACLIEQVSIAYEQTPPRT
jgi:hypothetical protein